MCDEHGRVVVGRARRAACRTALGMHVSDVWPRRAAVPTSEAKPLIRLPSTRSASATTRSCASSSAPPTASRLSRCVSSTSTARPVALEPVYRRRGDLRVAPSQRQRTRDLRGRASVARLHPRLGHRRKESCSRSMLPAPTARGSTSGPDGRPRWTTSRAALARGLGVEIEPTRPGQYRAGDIRHCFRRHHRSRTSSSASRRA